MPTEDVGERDQGLRARLTPSLTGWMANPSGDVSPRCSLEIGYP